MKIVLIYIGILLVFIKGRGFHEPLSFGGNQEQAGKDQVSVDVISWTKLVC